MITWMQRHKRWLVITIWISTIAFVGAGFVGWGSYDYGKSSGSIATVGSKEVKVSDLQNEYNALYNKYQNAFGKMFTQEMAKQFKLEEAAYNTVVQKFLLLNYAQELGLYITDKEIAQYLVNIQAFQKDNKFNKDTYLTVLKQNRTTPTDFESQVKKDLLVTKIAQILNTKVTKTEVNNLNLLENIEDEVSIKIIDSKNFNINTNKNNIKEYWEQNKDKYKSLKSTKVSMTSVDIGKNKKASKKDALKKYLKLKKGDIAFSKTLTLNSNSKLLTPENLEKVIGANIGTILKPIENNKKFIIFKIEEVQQPKSLSFSKALKSVKPDYIYNKKQELLNKKVQTLTNKFSGKNIGFINQTSTKTIKGLQKEEVIQLIKHIFNSQTTINSVVLNGGKAVVYKITNSRLSKSSQDNTLTLEDTLSNIKNNEIMSNLIKQLRNKYEVISNMKAD